MTYQRKIPDDVFDWLKYDPSTGSFVWIKATYRKQCWVGMEAGSLRQDGYVMLSLHGLHFLAHRAAWLWIAGAIPTMEIDHIDGNRGNNRKGNLRQVERLTNSQNEVRPRANNTTGFLGVCVSGNKFTSSVRTPSGRRIHLGSFDTAKAASDAYLEAKRKYQAGCTI